MSAQEARRVYYERREELRQMPKNAFIFLGPPTSGKTTQTLFLSETIRGKVLRGRDVMPELSLALESSRTLIDDTLFVPSLRDLLWKEVSPNLVVDNIPRTQQQADVILKWSQENNVVLHVITFRLTEEEVLKRSAGRIVCPQCGESYSPELKPPKAADKCDRDGTKLLPRPGDKPELLSEVFAKNMQLATQVIKTLEPIAKVYYPSASGTVYETAERMFKLLSPVIFYKQQMAEGYYRLRKALESINSRSLFISGMPTFVYGGRSLMKDFDILVPDNEIDELSKVTGNTVGEKHSSVADTRYADISPGVEIDSNLIVKFQGGKVAFPFDFLWEEARFIRFMGLECAIMGLEDLILLKAALGRQGIDDYGKFKSDLSDLEGLLGVQQIDYNKLKNRVTKIGMQNRLSKILKMLGVDL